MKNAEVDDSYIIPERPDTLYGTRVNGVFTISGVVHVIRNESELPFFREGEILVAEKIDPAWVEQLSLAKALIEDAGTAESVATAIAAQYDLAATVNVPDAMRKLRSGDIVTIHSSGEIDRILEQRAPDSPMRVSVPAAVSARKQDGIITATNVVAFSSGKKQKPEEKGAPVEDCPDEASKPDRDQGDDPGDNNTNSKYGN